jgi:thiamine biosynthesis lipoprotein
VHVGQILELLRSPRPELVLASHRVLAGHNGAMSEPISHAIPAEPSATPASNESGTPGLRRVEHIMGTAISFDVRDANVPPAALDEAFEYLRDIDRRFSTYKADSEISRLSRGEIAEADCSPDVRRVLELCDQIRQITEGYFDIRGHLWDGGIDPSGLVKGWSLENAGRILEAAGAGNYCINGGGDILIRGEPTPGAAWRVGIRHPLEADKLASVLAVREGAVATSGAYERGDHVLDPFTGKPPKGVLSITVVGPSLTYADAYATAAFAMGPTGLAWIGNLEGYQGCAITADPDGSNGRIAWTDGFESLLADRT